LVAAGGVTQQTALDLMLAGATAIGVGTDLIPVEAIERRQAARIRELALRFAGYVREARARMQRAKQKSPKIQKLTGIENCEKS
jgi:2-dehydro-3-deoxyphosphogluconate aldolase/(4S)-4-hydroxy-2-oxoglutarate aldolase